MKKFVCLLSLALAGILPAGAQDWSSILKGTISEAADRLTGGKATQWQMAGTWKYAGPYVKFHTDNALLSMGASGIEKTAGDCMRKAFESIGIEPGLCSARFDREGGFSIELGEKGKAQGGYRYDCATHVLTLEIRSAKEKRLASIEGFAYVEGGKLQILFSAKRVFEALRQAGVKLADHGQLLASAAEILTRFDGLYIGAEFTRE